MSKAFTRESDRPEDESSSIRLRPILPPGAKNYLTQRGAEQLREELRRRLEIERPSLTRSPQQDQAGLHSLNQRIAQLEQSLGAAVIVPAPPPPWDQVRFGATVSVRNRDAIETTYRIVGIDETDADRNWVSWLSPIAKALLNARLGERIRFRFPAGEEEMEIIKISYD